MTEQEIINKFEKLKKHCQINEQELSRRSWNIISAQKLSYEFIEYFQDKLNWDVMAYNQNFTEEFMHKHQDKIDWFDTCRYQKMSEQFIEEHAEYVDWDMVFVYQKLSNEFVIKHADKIDWKFQKDIKTKINRELKVALKKGHYINVN